MKKLIALAAMMLLTVLALSACTVKNNKSKEPAKQITMNKGKKVLVAYFSWSGNTKVVAGYIARKLNADTFEIVREKQYPTGYEPCTEEAKAELNTRPAIKGKVENMADYDVVFIGVPVWWYTAPMPVFTFLEQYDLKGKTIIPFCTCYTAPSKTFRDIEAATPDSEHGEPLSIVTQELGGKGMEQNYAKIDKWLKELGY